MGGRGRQEWEERHGQSLGVLCLPGCQSRVRTSYLSLDCSHVIVLGNLVDQSRPSTDRSPDSLAGMVSDETTADHAVRWVPGIEPTVW
jgi:hypothetical protein